MRGTTAKSKQFVFQMSSLCTVSVQLYCRPWLLSSVILSNMSQFIKQEAAGEIGAFAICLHYCKYYYFLRCSYNLVVTFQS